jgi:hypothetical protein
MDAVAAKTEMLKHNILLNLVVDRFPDGPPGEA